MSRNSVRTWMVLSIGLSLCVAPFLVRGDQATRDRLEQNRQAIATMTQSERDRLDRNYKAYQLMDAQEISTLKAFHEKLNQQSSGELELALDQYHAWLETIQPFQRDKLKETTDPQQRIALMNEMLQEQRNRDASRFLRGFLPYIIVGANWKSSKENLNKEEYKKQREKNERVRYVLDLFRQAPVLSDSSFSRLMAGLEESAEIHFTPQDRAELGKLEGQSRYMLLLELMKKRIFVRLRAAEGRRPEVLLEAIPQFEQAFEKLANSFDNYVENSKARDFINLKDDEKSSRKPSLRIQVIILKTMLVNVFAQLESANSPSQQKLEELFEELPEDEQDQLLELESIDFYKELATRGRSTETPSGPREVVRLFLSKETIERIGRSWGHRQRPSGDRNGQQIGDDNRRPGDQGGRPRNFDNRGPGERPPRLGDREFDGPPRGGRRGPGGRLDRDGRLPQRGDFPRSELRPGSPPRPREEAEKP